MYKQVKRMIIWLRLSVVLMFLFGVTGLGAQIITASGISVQGIVRTSDNRPVSEQNVQLDFQIINSSSKEILYSESNVFVATDRFGVFAHVLGVSDLDDVLFGRLAYGAYDDMRLIVSYGGAVMMNTRLNPVPFAAVAYNGVMVGTVLPYVGNEAPMGFLLCDGKDIPSGTSFANLKEVLGSNKTPNLKGLFLSGTSDSAPVDDRISTAIFKDVQEEQLARHNHRLKLTSKKNTGVSRLPMIVDNTLADGTVLDSNWGYARIHKVSSGGYNGQSYSTRLEDGGPFYSAHRYFVKNYIEGGLLVKHKHKLTGETSLNEQTGRAIRPFSYGVNYIIKY